MTVPTSSGYPRYNLRGGELSGRRRRLLKLYDTILRTALCTPVGRALYQSVYLRLCYTNRANTSKICAELPALSLSTPYPPEVIRPPPASYRHDTVVRVETRNFKVCISEYLKHPSESRVQPHSTSTQLRARGPSGSRWVS